MEALHHNGFMPVLGQSAADEDVRGAIFQSDNSLDPIGAVLEIAGSGSEIGRAHV